MSKAFFVNGGIGRVLCAIPGLEHYFNTNQDDSIIVAEAWMELFLASSVLRDKVYPVNHRNLFKDKLYDKEIVSLEPYRLSEYYTQKCNLIQAFDIQINNLKEIPETKPFNLSISKIDQAFGYNLVSQVRGALKKEKVIVFQPFGSSAKIEGNFIIDESGRSFELRDVVRIVEELGKEYGIILMSSLKLPSEKPLPAVIPDNVNLLQWMGVINAADYFLGCDSMGQHYAHALNKPATVVIGSTFPENISYPNNDKFEIVDNGLGKRVYSPIRMTSDLFNERGNEDLMILSDKNYTSIIAKIKNTLGVNKFQEKYGNTKLANTSTSTCNHSK